MDFQSSSCTGWMQTLSSQKKNKPHNRRVLQNSLPRLLRTDWGWDRGKPALCNAPALLQASSSLTFNRALFWASTQGENGWRTGLATSTHKLQGQGEVEVCPLSGCLSVCLCHSQYLCVSAVFLSITEWCVFGIWGQEISCRCPHIGLKRMNFTGLWSQMNTHKSWMNTHQNVTSVLSSSTQIWKRKVFSLFWRAGETMGSHRFSQQAYATQMRRQFFPPLPWSKYCYTWRVPNERKA